MAQDSTQSAVFKFVALRPPMTPSRDAASTNFTYDDRNALETPVGRFLAQFNDGNASGIQEALQRFIKDQNYDLAYPQSQGDATLDTVATAANSVPPPSISSAAITAQVENAAGQKVATLYGSDAATKTRHEVWDRYYAFYILSGFVGQDLTHLTNNLRIYHLLNILSRGQGIAGSDALKSILNATPVVDKLFTSLPKPKVPQPAQPQPEPSSKTAQYKALWDELITTNEAITSVRNLRFATTTHETSEKIAAPVSATTGTNAAARVTPQQRTKVTVSVGVDPTSFNALSKTTKHLLGKLQITENNLSKPDTVATLTTRMDQLTSQAAAIDDPMFLEVMPQQALEIRGLSGVVSTMYDKDVISKFPLPVFGNVRGEIKPLGIGDLKVVKQTLKSYQLGEVAHIENVLRGEYFERKFRTLDRTEQTLTTSEETIEDTTRDTQTTERFELKKESENTIAEQMSVQAGVTVTGSYGMVTIGAHGDFAYGTSSTESSKTSSNFAREVVDRSVTRIQKNIKTERVTKQLHEVEEIDDHGLDNKGQPDNLTGVYRWVDKYYEAQIFNYGKRLMFEFIIPEPSAFFEYAQTHQPQKQFTPPKPLPATLTHKDITEWNYQNYIAAYQVQGCTPPPAEYKVVSAVLSSDAQIDNGTSLAKSSKDLVVPDGYQCDTIAATISFIYENYPQFKLEVGADDLWFSSVNNTARRRDDWTGGTSGTYDNIIPIAMTCYDVNAYFISVMANCSRQWQKYETWQIQTFEKIVTAYQALKATYDQQVAQQQTQQGVVIHGQNPLINREIEKTELKKGSVKLLMDTWEFGSFGAMKQTGDDPPDFDIFQSVGEGKTEQFFEQAFEWENITYLFYPYFWGREGQWIHKINTYDEDPLFTKFLQSGAARVVVPVHPGYNDAVMYFLENNGAIWNGGDPPRLNDPLFISLADELRDLTDDLQNATPDGDPWQVILPTTLVYLQKDSTLPSYP